MWARRAKFIAIGVVVLAIGLLLIRPRPEPLVVMVLYDTSAAPMSYSVEVVNAARTLHDFAAWTEYKTNGVWMRLPPPYGGTLKPSAKEVFTMPKPQHGKARIAVFYGRVSSDRWERWMNRIKALVGIRPKLEEMYIDAP